MPFFLAPVKKKANEEASQDELRRCREASATVPAVEAVTWKELAATRPWETKDVLDVGRRSGERAADRRIEWSAHRGKKKH
jgi:hypothetical protein